MLQLRDFVNVHFLYGGNLLLPLSVFLTGFCGGEVHLPSFIIGYGNAKTWLIRFLMFLIHNNTYAPLEEEAADRTRIILLSLQFSGSKFIAIAI